MCIFMRKNKLKLTMKTVYSKRSHAVTGKGQHSPAYSTGTYNKKTFSVVVHLTPELRRKPRVRKSLIAHERREATELAEGKSVHYSHRKAASKDPKYFKGDKGFYTIWNRVGKDKDFWKKQEEKEKKSKKKK